MATPTSSKAHAMRMKMRQHAHLQAVGITFCLILSPERRASRCCQCMSGRLQHLRCDHVNDSDSAQQETFSQCTAGQRAGGGNGLRPKCKEHWHMQPWARAGQRDCNHQLQRSHRRRPQESDSTSIIEEVASGRGRESGVRKSRLREGYLPRFLHA